VTVTPARSYTRIAIAIVIAGVVIAASILFAATNKTTTTPLNIIGTTTMTNTVTQLSTTTATQLSIVTLTSLSTTTAVQTQTSVTQVNYTITDTYTQTLTTTGATGLDYLSDLPGCTVSEGYISEPEPCFGQISTAVAFNCEAAAATSKGCNQQVNFTGTSDQSMNITVWYSYLNNGEGPPQNCKWTEYLPAPIGPQTAFAYCIPVNPISFYVTIPAPLPT